MSSTQEVTISICLCELDITTVRFSNIEEIRKFQQNYSLTKVQSEKYPLTSLLSYY